MSAVAEGVNPLAFEDEGRSMTPIERKAAHWRKGVAEVSQILDGQEGDKWKIADMVLDLVKDGDPEAREKLKKLHKDLGGRLAEATLSSYRRTAIKFPPSKRIYRDDTGKNKPFWYYAQAAHHVDAEKILAAAKSEYHLREMLGGRDPYRVQNSRVQAALKNEQTVKDLVTPDVVREWAAIPAVRQVIVDEVVTSYGSTPQTNVLKSEVDRLREQVEMHEKRDDRVAYLLRNLAHELRFSTHKDKVEEILAEF